MVFPMCGVLPLLPTPRPGRVHIFEAPAGSSRYSEVSLTNFLSAAS
jgi:hypothetical protein